MATLACLAEELSRHDGCINSCNAPALAKMDFQLNGGQNKLTIRGFAGRCDKNDTLKASDIALQGYSCHECESRKTLLRRSSRRHCSTTRNKSLENIHRKSPIHSDGFFVWWLRTACSIMHERRHGRLPGTSAQSGRRRAAH